MPGVPPDGAAFAAKLCSPSGRFMISRSWGGELSLLRACERKASAGTEGHAEQCGRTMSDASASVYRRGSEWWYGGKDLRRPRRRYRLREARRSEDNPSWNIAPRSPNISMVSILSFCRIAHSLRTTAPAGMRHWRGEHPSSPSSPQREQPCRKKRQLSVPAPASIAA